MNRGWDNLCQGKNNGCKFKYKTIYRGGSSGALDILQRKGFIKSFKMRFKDSGTWRKGKATDIFRFWFIDKKDFEKMILSQTLDLYLT